MGGAGKRLWRGECDHNTSPSLQYKQWRMAPEAVSYTCSVGGWGDGSDIKSSCCSSGGPKIGYQRPHGCSQLVTPVTDDPALFGPLRALHAHGACVFLQAKH